MELPSGRMKPRWIESGVRLAAAALWVYRVTVHVIASWGRVARSQGRGPSEGASELAPVCLPERRF